MKSSARTLFIPSCLAFLSLLVSTAAGAPFEYQLTDLGTLPGGHYSSASHINNRGEIAGVADDGAARVPFLVTTNGRMIKLPFPDTVHSPAVWDLNDLGQAIVYGIYHSQIGVGIWGVPATTLLVDRTQALEVRQVVGRLNEPTIGFALNNLGDLVGASTKDEDFRLHPYLFHNGVFGFLDEAPGSPEWMQTVDINDAGTILAWGQGFSGTQAVVHTFLMVNGVITDIGTTPGSDWVWGERINNRGTIAGIALRGEIDLHEFLWQGGIMHDLGAFPVVALNNLDDMVGTGEDGEYVVTTGGITRPLKPLLQGPRSWRGLTIHSLNDHGQMVGEATVRGETHAILITPIKKP